MSLSDDVKSALRITTNDSGIGQEVLDLIDAAKMDLVHSGGVSDEILTDSNKIDALIKRAIITYAKANFGYDNPEADRFHDAYVMLKQHISLYGDHYEI